MKRAVKVFIEGQELDLFDDEQIQVSSSVQNVYDISKSNTDISQSFTVPGTARNNQIFQHFYETDVDSTIDHNLRRDGFIEIDLTTFKKGRIQLDKANVEKGKIKSYTITFYGKLVSLKDLFGDDKLQDLDHSGISHLFTWAEVYGRITGTIASDVDYPLISSNRLWEYNGNAYFINPNWLTATATNNNITTAGGSINLLTELFPAVRLNAIMNMIAIKYGINFNSSFFSTEEWRAAFLWYKNRNDVQVSTLANYIDFDYRYSNVTLDIDTSQYVNLSLNTVNPTYQPGFLPNSYHRIAIDVYSLSSTTVTYYVDVYINGVLTNTFSGINGSLGGVSGFATVYLVPNVAGLNDTVTFKVRANGALSINTNVRYTFQNGAVNSYSEYACVIQNLLQYINLETCAPDMKIADFFSGILKQFNMVVENLDDTEYLVEPLPIWYSNGNVYDITTATDFDSVEVGKVPLYRRISFKYQPSESTMNKYYLQQWQKEYGDTEQNYSYDGGEYNIQVPFENLMFNQYDHAGAATGLQVGFALNNALAPYVPKPCILYRYGVVTGLPHHIRFKDGLGNSATTSEYVMYGQDYTNSVTGIDYSLNFSPETSTYHRYAIQQGLFATYYFQYLYNLYNLKNRITTVKAVLPLSILSTLRLNDRLIIRDKRYIINDMQTNLTTGQATLRLLNDFMPTSPDQIVPPPNPEE
jgi:hypothetical protein